MMKPVVEGRLNGRSIGQKLHRLLDHRVLGAVVVLVLAMASSVRAVSPEKATAAVMCPRQPTGGEMLTFKLKKPFKQHGRATAAVLHKRFPCLTLLCTSQGEMFTAISQDDARRLLGKHAVFRAVKGAGNVAGRNAHFADIKPAGFVPAILRAHVERLEFDDDPKYPYTAPDAAPCE